MNAAVIIVNYNGYEETIRCVNELKTCGFDKYKIIVVDNKSTDDSVNRIRKNIGNDVILLESDINMGYAAGNNIGIKYAIKEGVEYICVMNNDVIVMGDFFEKCINYLDVNDDVAFVGPMLIDYNKGYIQSTGGNVDYLRGLTPLINFGKDRKDIKGEIQCDFISGACIICKTDLINKIGYIPELYFAYYEETEWCIKAQKIGMRNVCLADCSIIHKGAVTMKKNNGINWYLGERNKVVFMSRNVSKLLYVRFLIYLFFHTIYMGIFKDKNCFKYFSFYLDGIIGRFNSKYCSCIGK